MHEIDNLYQVSQNLGIQPEVGIRIKPVAKSSGHWKASSGDKAKFGLSTAEVMEVVEKLQCYQMQDSLCLLHFHIGSQVTLIASIKNALKEATRMYTEIKKMFPALSFFDVGGGLAVDYDGSRTNFESSMNLYFRGICS